MIDARHQPRLSCKRAHFRREERRPRVARLEFLDGASQIAKQFGMIHVEMLKQQADVVARLFQEFDKPVLDFDVVICFGQAKAGCAFKRPLTDWVQLADKTL